MYAYLHIEAMIENLETVYCHRLQNPHKRCLNIVMTFSVTHFI